MWELTKRISWRISPVLSKVEPEPDLYTSSGSDQKVPAPQHCNTACGTFFVNISLSKFKKKLCSNKFFHIFLFFSTFKKITHR